MRGRDRRADTPTRSARARDRRHVPRLALGCPGRPSAVSARDRHAHGRRVVRRDRRLRTVRPAGAADEIRRAGPLREHHWPAAPPRVDHEDRVRSRPPTARRSSPGTTANDPKSARRSPSARTGSHPLLSRSPGQPNCGCIVSGTDSRSAPNDGPSSRSRQPASSPGSVGRSPRSSDSTPPLTPSAGSVAARHARGTRDVAMSNQPRLATLACRERIPTTNHGPAATRIRAYQHDPRRAQHAGPPPTQPTTPPVPNQRKAGNS